MKNIEAIFARLSHYSECTDLCDDFINSTNCYIHFMGNLFVCSNRLYSLIVIVFDGDRALRFANHFDM